MGHQQVRDTPKQKLYQLYWKDGLDTEDLAERYDTAKEYIRKEFRRRGIRYDIYDNRGLFIFTHRQRSYFYKLYWGDDMTFREIAEEHGFSDKFAIQIFNKENIPTLERTQGDKWYDKKRGIPMKYKQPRDEHQEQSQQEQPLPDDPNPEKYLLDTPLVHDKERLYELHWKYGCSVAHIQEMANVECDARHRMEKLGIPTRYEAKHSEWQPHHGVPPMFEWPRDRDDDDEGVEWSLSDENMATGD